MIFKIIKKKKTFSFSRDSVFIFVKSFTIFCHNLNHNKADGKAARAGLREGDVITRVNGRDVKWARHSDVVDMLQIDKLEIEIVTVQVSTLIFKTGP